MPLSLTFTCLVAGLISSAQFGDASSPPWQHPRWTRPEAAHQAAAPGGHTGLLNVQTTSGLISGFINSSHSDVRQFLGVPFAKPPTGKLRFEPPESLHEPHDYVKATAPPPACPQVPTSNGSLFSMSSPEFFNQQPWDEDCLSLSIWAPNTTKNKLPGLQQGSSSVPYQQPLAWVQRTKEHIVVALQYRLNIFGFPNAAGLDRTNLGLLDQRLGIEWVRDNIHAFGGDPGRMILWGQSSGGGAVDAHNFAFPDDPIVQGFISNSGSALFPPGTGLTTIDPTHSNFSTVAEGLGCSSEAKDQASCMRNKPAKDIIDFMTFYAANKTMPRLNFVATPDNIVAFANYTERYTKGLLSDRPAIFGSNANEGVAQVPLPPNPTQMGPNQTIADQATFGIFQCPAYASALGRSLSKRKTYLYYYTGNFTDVSPLFWEGAYHMSELPQIFGTRGQYHAHASDLEITTSNAMQDLWLDFAKNPFAAEDAGWAEFSSGELLILGSKSKAVDKQRISKLEGDCMAMKEG